MPGHNIGGQIRDGQAAGNNAGNEATVQVSPSSNPTSTRHEGHPHAREHPPGYRPARSHNRKGA